MNNKQFMFLAIILCAILGILIIGNFMQPVPAPDTDSGFSTHAAKEYKRITNLRVKNWLFADDTWAGLETWADTDSIDTLVVSGIDTTCYFFAFPIDVSPGFPGLYGNISRNGDSIFVTCDSVLAATNKYNWIVVRP